MSAVLKMLAAVVLIAGAMWWPEHPADVKEWQRLETWKRHQRERQQRKR